MTTITFPYFMMISKSYQLPLSNWFKGSLSQGEGGGRGFLTCLLFLISLSLIAQPQEPTYRMVKAEKGDGVISLLRRHQLEKHDCNYTEFYRLNQLKKNAGLLVGRQYKLPIRIYPYNGKSIRSTIGDNDWEQAVAIQEYNEMLVTEAIRTQDFRQDKILWVPHHILSCPDDLNHFGKNVLSGEQAAEELGEAIELGVQNTTSGPRVYDIFGKKLAKTPLIDKKLAGQIFYICAGHGGLDPGAMGRRGGKNLCEDEYAYDVALRFCRNIIAHGGVAYMVNRDANDGIRDEVYLPCDKDELLWGGVPMIASQKGRLQQRSDIINALYQENLAKGLLKQTVVCFHVDSRGSKKRIDLFFYYHDTDLLGKARANRMHEVVKAKYAKYQKGRDYQGTVTARDLHMLRETLPTSVYIELGNIRNAADQRRIVLEKNRQYLADWLYEGLF
ncbi:MAG: N-acetylmuramoyl-L-alanine amidase [Bacteroidota bacterium]